MNSSESQVHAEASDSHPEPATLKRLHHALGPVAAGMMIDLVDLITFGPIGLILGLPVGAVAGYWLGHSMGLSPRGCGTCAIAAGVYCTIPFTELVLLGALSRYQNFAATDSLASSGAAEPLPENGIHNT